MAKEESTLSICLPGESGWELWKQSPSGATLAQTASLEDGGTPASFKHADVLAYPVLASFVLPTLAQTGDAEMIDAVVSMNLEKNGLKVDGGPGELHKTRIVERGENLSLAVTSLLHEQVTPDLPEQRPTHYELSPFFYYLPDDSLVIWKELGKLVVCVTKADNPVYFQALTSEEVDDGAIQEIENLLMPLDFQGIAHEVKQVVLWTEAPAEARQALANALRLPLKAEKRPAPSYTNAVSTYEPTAVALAQIREARIRKIRNIAMLCGGVYLLVIGGMVGRHIWRLKENTLLEGQAKSLQVLTSNVEPTFETWHLTEPLREKDRFVAETLRRILETVSARAFRIRITSVKVTTEKPAAGPDGSAAVGIPQKRIEIKGETPIQRDISAYRNDLSNRADTKIYKWETLSPEAKRGDNEPFTIIGVTKQEE